MAPKKDKKVKKRSQPKHKDKHKEGTALRRIKSETSFSAKKCQQKGDWTKARSTREANRSKGRGVSPLQIIGKTLRRRSTKIGQKDEEKEEPPKQYITEPNTETNTQYSSDIKEKNSHVIRSVFHGMKGESLKDWATRVEQMGVSGLHKQFLELKKQAPSHTTENWERNMQKNRYNDVRCFDYSRVRLEDCPSGDYIHANFVDGYKRHKQFICTQGPMDTTLEDFWRMIWQQKCVVVVMLTRFVEMQKIKCGIYFREEQGEEIEVGEFLIQTVLLGQDPVSEAEKLIVRDLLLTHKGVQRRIKHLHYAEWPDKGTPQSAAQFICILSIIHHYHVKLSKEHNLSPANVPILVHCSAGIGRTGTLVAVDVCREHLKKTKTIDVEEVVRRLRGQRALSVQTDSQYIFVHRAIIEWSVMMHRIKFNYEKFFGDP